MPFERPSLSSLVSRIQADLAAGLPGADAYLRRTAERVLAYVLAGISHGLHGHLAWVVRQLLPDSADDEYVVRWAQIWGLEPKAAAKAQGLIHVTGVAATVLEAGTRFQRSDGAQFETVDPSVLTGGQADVSVTAVDAGAAGDTDAGATLSLVSPVVGVDSAAAVQAPGLEGGTDTETTEALRARLLSRIQRPPKGGGAGDYVNWALEVAGVTRAWERPAQFGLGTVGVTFAVDDAAGGPIPDEPTRQAVEDHLLALAPVTAQVTVWVPESWALPLRIRVTPDTAAVRAAVQAELESLLRREAEPGGTILLSHLREAISLAAGETDHELLAPVADIVPASNQLVTLGSVEWE